MALGKPVDAAPLSMTSLSTTTIWVAAKELKLSYHNGYM